MVIQIDFDSDEAIYIQLKNQIIMGIATSLLQEGDSLPSVRQMAVRVGINMHTVNKAYALLQDEGFLVINRRGAFISLDSDHDRVLGILKAELKRALASASAKNITADEVHGLIDDILKEYRSEQS